MRKLIALLALLPALACAQSYTNIPNLRSGNMDFTATIRANGSACASGTAIVSGGGSVTCVAVIPTSQKGANNGVATLDSGGKVPTAQLPFSGLTYDGSWNANTNSPSLADGSGTGGHFYIVSVAGSQNLGSGSISFAVGDWALYNGTIWQKVPSSAAVSSVFGRTGAVVATSGDYTATQVTNTPAGGISATTAQAAINELDTEKQAAASTLTSWAALTRASGFDTFTQTPSSANLRGLLTDESGTGLAYFQGGALGTPASGTLTSATGLPWSTGLTGVPTTAVGYGITGGAKLDAYAGGDTPSAFTLGIVDSADAATWRSALGAGTSSATGTVTSVSGSGGSTGLTLTGGPITTSGILTLGGTLADGSLSSNVPLKNAANTFTATQTVAVSDNAVGVAVKAASGQIKLHGYHSSFGGAFVQVRNGADSAYQPLNITSSALTLNTTSGLLAMNGAGNVSVSTPSSGTAFTVNGLTGSHALDVGSTGANLSLGFGFEAGISSGQWNVYSRGTDPLTVGTQGATALSLATNAVARVVIGSGGGVQFGAPTGGDKGAGSLNAAGSIYVNNTAVALSDGSNLTALPAISGANLTTLNASNVSSGTLDNARLATTVTRPVFNATTDIQVNGTSVCRSNGTNCPSGANPAYGRFNGSAGGCTIVSSNDITSCSRTGAGAYTVVLTTDRGHAPICVLTAINGSAGVIASYTSAGNTTVGTNINNTISGADSNFTMVCY